jgi:hypothetical protein
MLGIDLATAKSVTLTMEEGFVREQGTGLPVPGRSLASIKGSVKAEATFVPAQANLSCVTSVKYTNNAAVLDASGGFTVSAQLNAVGVTDAQSQFVFDALVGVIKPYSAEVTSEANMVTINDFVVFFDSDIESQASLSAITLESVTRSNQAEIQSHFGISITGDRTAKLLPSELTSQFSMSIDAVKDVKAITTETMVSSLTCQMNYITSSVVADLNVTATLEQNNDFVFVWYGQNFAISLFYNSFSSGQTSFSQPVEVDWGDGTITSITGNTSAINYHTYSSAQEWQIKIRPAANQPIKGLFRSGFSGAFAGGLVAVKAWSNFGLENISQMFQDAHELTVIVPDSLPPSVTNMSQAFGNFTQSWDEKDHTTLGNRIQNWDVSNVENFSFCWESSSGYIHNYQDCDLRLWRTGSATNMDYMFRSSRVNQDLSGWCVPLIPSAPIQFGATGPGTTTLLFQPPVWGTCP